MLKVQGSMKEEESRESKRKQTIDLDYRKYQNNTCLLCETRDIKKGIFKFFKCL